MRMTSQYSLLSNDRETALAFDNQYITHSSRAERRCCNLQSISYDDDCPTHASYLRRGGHIIVGISVCVYMSAKVTNRFR